MTYYPKTVRNSRGNWIIYLIPKNREMLVFSKHKLMGKWYDFKDFPLDLWHWEMGRWRLRLQNRYVDKCPCGNDFGKFKRKPMRIMRGETDEDVINQLSQPYVCHDCYYKHELKMGRWAPKSVREMVERGL